MSWLVPHVMNVVLCLKQYLTFKDNVREWCHEGPLSKMPRLSAEDSEEANVDSAFIEIANEVKDKTEDRSNVHVDKYEEDGFTTKKMLEKRLN